MQHDQQQYVHLQLHDDINAFNHSAAQHHLDQQTGLYGSTDDGSYYGYYPTEAQYAAPSQAHQPIIQAKTPSGKRPLRPAGGSIPVSGPSAASSHVRTLPAKAGSASTSTTNFGNVANQSAFINKLYTMLEEADQNLISWDQTGTFFIVKNTTDFSKTVLPLYFKHNNFASFVRQLNMYGFHKINDSFFKLNNTCSEVWEFKHHDFRRGEFALLSNIKRKAPKSSSSGSKSTYATTRPYSNHTVNSSIASSPLCMMTPQLPTGSTPTALKMDSCSDLLPGNTQYLLHQQVNAADNEKVEELMGRVFELETKLATLSESYELVCNQALGCKKELDGYSGVMTHVVSLLATMSQNDPSLRSEVQSQLARLAQATLELTSPHAVQYSSTVAASSSRKPSKRQASIDDDDDLDAEDNDDDDDNVKEDSPFEEEEDGIATINEDVEIVPTKSSHKRKNTGGDKKGEQVHKKGKMNSLSLMTPPIGNHGKVTVKEGPTKKSSRTKA